MLNKLETKSHRVKGLCFHPKRPWILASLHNGLIQLWDYRIRTLLERFEEHAGLPVRGICFHPSQPLFVSGGDDFKIKVWNYKLRRCLFTLVGHLDYIRTVQFHSELPWILSASDDMQIRIWNWQSRTNIAVLSGHTHYVMSAAFHPREDLVVSASLDQTVRVWDISGLHKRNVSPASGVPGGVEDSLKIAQNDLFGNPTAVVKYVLEGHDRGVNWASFHPTLPLIVSGADDRYVKLWRMSETKAWEVDTLRGHLNNVSCVIFHPRSELILSNSEDKTIRVWDMTKRVGIQNFKRESDRFWILAAHPENNLFAAGHDSGLIVFKLEKERPPYAVYQSSLFFIKDKSLRSYDFSTGKEAPILALKKSTKGTNGFNNLDRFMSYNPDKKAILIGSDNDGGSYELYTFPATKGSGPNSSAAESSAPKKGTGMNAIWVARNRFAVLDVKGVQIIVYTNTNEVSKKIPVPAATDMIFPGGEQNTVLLRNEDKILLFDLNQRRKMAEITAFGVKFVFWSPDKEFVVLMSKENLTVANKKLEVVATIHESIRLKSGIWTHSGSSSKAKKSSAENFEGLEVSSKVFIYTTLNHLKYCLINGDHGVVRTLDVPIYVVGGRGTRIWGLDRDSKVRELLVDTTEFKFKLALMEKRYDEILAMVQPGNNFELVGSSIVSYLQKKGYPNIALNFVKDPKLQFNLALECGDINVAEQAARVLEEKEAWSRLGVEALRQGNHQVVEFSYQKTKNFDRLSFLYLITGNKLKLEKMLKIADMRHDTMSRFHNSLYLGDVEERVKILIDAGQIYLAHALATSHQLPDLIEQTTALLPGPPPESKIAKSASLLLPPLPILKMHESNWPLLNVGAGPLLQAAPKKHKNLDVPATPDINEPDPEWPDEPGLPGIGDPIQDEPSSPKGEQDANGWIPDEDDLFDIPVVPSGAKGTASSLIGSDYYPPPPGKTINDVWVNNAGGIAADYVAAGDFETATTLLTNQIGVVNFAPLKPLFLSIYMGSKVPLSTFANVPPLLYGLERQSFGSGFPLLGGSSYSFLIEKFQTAMAAMNKGAFAEAKKTFLNVLQALTLTVVSGRDENSELQQMLTFCREYLIGLRLEETRKELKDDPVTQVKLAVFFTHCGIQQPHKILTLKNALRAAYRIENYKLAAGLGKRLLDLNPKPDAATDARKAIKFAETNNTDKHDLGYNEKNPFVLCALSFTPIYKNSKLVECPYCKSSFLPQHAGKLCVVCQLAQIGRDAKGMKSVVTTSSRD